MPKLTSPLRRPAVGFGPGGWSTVEACPGDFVYVPKRVAHRESNPSGESADIIVVRAGRGESTVNVDGPAWSLAGVRSPAIPPPPG